jgi:hypothetical protein
MEPLMLAIEIQREDSEALAVLKQQHPSHIKIAQAHGIDGAEWLTFVVEMTEVLAPYVFASLTLLLAQQKRVVIIHDGERKPLSAMELEALQALQRVIEALATIFHDRDKAVLLAKDAGFPASRLPDFTTAIAFWTKVSGESRHGALAGGMRPIIEAAAKSYPHNPMFTGYLRSDANDPHGP